MKKKIIYLSLLLIIIIILSTSYFSYAFFSNKTEKHGKLNIVAGILDYKIESSDLKDNSMTISSGDTKIITLNIKSLNNVSSKYELYYVLENNTDLVTVGFLEDSFNTTSGILDNYESKKVDVIIRNLSDSSQKITFGVDGGLINSDLVLSDDKSSLVDYCSKEDVYTFDYTGAEQEFVVPCDGEYQLETWGASGVDIVEVTAGRGGYSYGNITLSKNQKTYINVGGTGQYVYLNGINSSTIVFAYGGYNGGGDSGAYWGYNYISGGGGATHIATISGLLTTLENYQSNILIVSGGGAGSWYLNNAYYTIKSGSGGGFKGGDGSGIYYISETEGQYVSNPLGGGQLPSTVIENPYDDYRKYSKGKFGQAAPYDSGETTGAGGGYYGGDSAIHGAGGGSGYIGNSLLTNKGMYCYNCEESSEENTKTISITCTSEIPTQNCSKYGNGYAKITYLGE